MDKNRLIKDNLEFHLENSIRLFQHEFSFQNLLWQEIRHFDSITWLSDPDIDLQSYKAEKLELLKELVKDTDLQEAIRDTISGLPDVQDMSIQKHLEEDIIRSLEQISTGLPNEKKHLSLNLLFLEHDYFPEACFVGYDDPGYQFKLLSGQEYLEYRFNNEMFNGAGKLNYTPMLTPFLGLEEKLGEDMVEVINDALSGGAYLMEIRKLFFLNGFLGVHICLERIKIRVRALGIPMKEEVFVFGNEHDSEPLNIFVL